MKQRSMVLAMVAMIPFAVAVAQTPPTPPTPVTPATPVTPVTPAPAPATPLIPLEPLRPLLPPGAYDRYELDEMRRDAQRMAEEARREGRLAGEEGRRIAQLAAEDARRIGQHAAEEGRRAAEEARRAMEDARLNLNHDFNFNFNFDFAQPTHFSTPLPAQGALWNLPGQFKYQGEPADSLFQLAYESFSRQDYSRAASRFGEVIAKYPNYSRFGNAVYYQAFSLYRVGTLEALRQGLKVIETNQSKLPYSSRTPSDLPGLQANILRALVERKEPSADEKLKDLYAKYPSTTCDKDMVGIQSQVLNSLYHSDPEAAMPHIRNALAKRDPCSARLRADAVTLLGNRPSEDKAAILIDVVKTDTVRAVRAGALEMLARMPGDAAINTLTQLMSDPDEYISGRAVRALMRSDNARARSAIKTQMLDKREGTESQRREAIRSFDRNNMTAEDAAYLRNLFNRRDESDRIKEEVLNVLAQVPTEENIKFLLDVSKNPNESSTLRSRALRVVTRTSLSTDELIKLYDASDARSMRQTLVQALSDRREQPALNKLLEIAKCSTDPEVRRYTIQALLNKNDKNITEQVLNLMNNSGGPKC